MGKERLEEYFAKMEAQKIQILTAFEQLDESALTARPDQMWSVIQAMRHVQISEEMSASYIEKKSQAGENLPKRGWVPIIRLKLLFLTYFFGMKFKAPAILQEPPVTSLDELKADWDATRKKLKGLIDQYPENLLNRAVYKHPFAGMLSLPDAFMFMNGHLAHHIRQVDRIKKALKMPSADGNK